MLKEDMSLFLPFRWCQWLDGLVNTRVMYNTHYCLKSPVQTQLTHYKRFKRNSRHSPLLLKMSNNGKLSFSICRAFDKAYLRCFGNFCGPDGLFNFSFTSLGFGFVYVLLILGTSFGRDLVGTLIRFMSPKILPASLRDWSHKAGV